MLPQAQIKINRYRTKNDRIALKKNLKKAIKNLIKSSLSNLSRTKWETIFKRSRSVRCTTQANTNKSKTRIKLSPEF